MRLLLVEDKVRVGAGIRLGLRQDEFFVDWVRNARAAHEALQSGSYSVAILDLGLPRKHCLAVLDGLHQRNVPVVFIDGDRLSKAVDLDRLARRIHAAARRQVDGAEGGSTIFALPFSWG
jgi:DNA-binding NtrC family response regulator